MQEVHREFVVRGFRSKSGVAALANDIERFLRDYTDLDYSVDIQYVPTTIEGGTEHSAMVIITKYSWEEVDNAQ